jgi:hypothetical protein
MRRVRPVLLITWGLCFLAAASSLVAVDRLLLTPSPSLLYTVGQIVVTLSPLLFAIPGTLIINRQPRNSIGWLLLGPALITMAALWIDRYLSSFTTAPQPSFALMLMVWVSEISWVAFIFPLLVIPILFPTGRPPSRRWGWTVYLAAGMAAFFLLITLFSRELSTDSITWTLPNPQGFLDSTFFQIIILPWMFLLCVLTVASVAAVITRYRRAATIEREQIKWLLYACVMFGVVYFLTILVNGVESVGAAPMHELVNLLFSLSTAGIPVVVAIAILRYHLFDIDVIIRLTLIYAILSALLGVVFTAGIILAQWVFLTITGQSSSAAVVITTLATAALFQPLRRRIQSAINRRFYRESYNAERALAQFTSAARSGSDLDELTDMLLSIAQQTLQPTQVSLQLKGRVSEQEGGAPLTSPRRAPSAPARR